MRNNLGEPLVNWPILFQCNGDGKDCMAREDAPAPGSLYVGPVQTGEVMATDGNGSDARDLHAPAMGIGFVTIGVRPYGTDTSYTPFYRYVEIVLQ